MVPQELAPFKFKISLEEISFWKSLKEMKSTFSKILIGTTVVFALKGYAHKKFKTFRKSAEEV